jgi:trans,polycis-polyprenyl diphosphate synthase
VTGDRTGVRPPDPHSSGARPPAIPAEFVPRHVALVMDGNGRWAKQRGLPRTEGHKAGEHALFDVIMGAIEVGIPYLSAYAFSTENWKRSPDEVRFLMGFNRDVIRRRRDQLNEMGVRVRWAGRRARLWRSVISELEDAERMTANNSVLTLQFCVNYGGRAEITEAAAGIAADVAAGRLRADKIDETVFARYLDEPGIPDVDLFVRSSGEQRTSNFLIWQSAYAEFVFLDTLFPDFDRRHLWQACEIYARRDRRYGGAEPNRLPLGRAADGGEGAPHRLRARLDPLGVRDALPVAPAQSAHVLRRLAVDSDADPDAGDRHAAGTVHSVRDQRVVRGGIAEAGHRPGDPDVKHVPGQVPEREAVISRAGRIPGPVPEQSDVEESHRRATPGERQHPRLIGE